MFLPIASIATGCYFNCKDTQIFEFAKKNICQSLFFCIVILSFLKKYTIVVTSARNTIPAITSPTKAQSIQIRILRSVFILYSSLLIWLQSICSIFASNGAGYPSISEIYPLILPLSIASAYSLIRAAMMLR